MENGDPDPRSPIPDPRSPGHNIESGLDHDITSTPDAHGPLVIAGYIGGGGCGQCGGNDDWQAGLAHPSDAHWSAY